MAFYGGLEEARKCCVSERGCQAPHNSESSITADSECFVCGNYVCKNPGCSRLKACVVFDGGTGRLDKKVRKRVCRNCGEDQEEWAQEDEERKARGSQKRGEEEKAYKIRSAIFRGVEDLRGKVGVTATDMDRIQPLLKALDLGLWGQARALFEFIRKDLDKSQPLQDLLDRKLRKQAKDLS